MRFFLTLTVISLSLTIITTDSRLDEFLRDALEMFRSKMKTGIPDLGIPILDPMNAPNISLKVNKGILNAEFNVSRTVVRDLSNFKIKSIHFDIDKVNLSMQLEFPLLDFHGIYDCDGNISVAHINILPIHGRGNATFNMTSFQFGLSTTVARKGDHFQLTSLNLGLDFQSLKVDIDNIFGSEELAKIVNGILSTFGKSLFDLERKSITKALDKMLLDRANEILKNISISSIVPVTYEQGDALENIEEFPEQRGNNQRHDRSVHFKMDSLEFPHSPKTREKESTVDAKFLDSESSSIGDEENK